MDSASGATYIGKRQLEAYAKKRKEHQEQIKLQKLKKDTFSAEEQKKPEVDNEEKKEEIKQSDHSSSDEEEMPKAAKRAMRRASSEEDMGYRSMEQVDSDELDGGLNLSDCGEDFSNQYRVENKASKQKRRARPARQFKQEIDTNVFKIGFATLQDKAEIATGDPTFCKTCQACLNINSELEQKEEQQIWKCEFCNTSNEVDVEDEEKPKTTAINYIVEAAAQVQDKKVMGSKEISVVFCIDQSGSMCCSQPIQGKFHIKGDKTQEMKDLMKFSDGSDQFLQGESNMTYVSRMQCLQAAIDQQIQDMTNGAADRKLGLVSFNNEVKVVGDGSNDPQTISGDKLCDYDYLMKNGSEQGQLRMKNKINETHKQLTKKLMELEETGPTALGPAVATSIAMAAEGAPGSQVVICTDGLANIGLGAFDEAKTNDEIARVDEFYERLGQFAKSKGLTINIVSIIGDECNLDSLSKLAELTGGNVERVDPVSLTKNFSNILSEPIIASNVVTKVKLHKGLQFRNEQEQNLSEDKSLLVRDIGNVTAQTEITFEYTLKKISELIKMEDIDMTLLKQLPFQTQITYTALDGSKCIRVITQQQDISNDRDQLEQKADFQLLGQNCIQQSANMARVGNHRFAQAYAKNWGRKMKKQGVTEQQKNVRGDFIENFKGLYDGIGQQDEEEQVEEGIMKAKKSKKKGKKKELEMANDYISDSESEDYEDEKLDQIGSIQNKKAGGILSGISNFFGGSKKKANKKKNKRSAEANIDYDEEEEGEKAIPQNHSMPISMSSQSHNMNRHKLNDNLSAGLYNQSKFTWSKK